MFPFHTWLPDAHVEAPTAGSVILAARPPEDGDLRLRPLLAADVPAGGRRRRGCSTSMVALAIVGIVYGAMVTLVQKDMKKLIAYSSVAHLGFVMLGHLRAQHGRHPGRDPADDQPRHLDGRRSSSSSAIVYERRHTRHDRGVRRARRQMPIYATLLPGHGALLDGAAAPERLHRRVHDPAGRVRAVVLVGLLRGDRHRPRRRLPAVALPARLLRRALEPGEQEPRRT